METVEHVSEQETLVMASGTMVSFVPRLLKDRGWGPMDLVRRGLALDTSYKLRDGDINITVATLKSLCDIFEVDSVSEILEYRKNGSE